MQALPPSQRSPKRGVVSRFLGALPVLFVVALLGWVYCKWQRVECACVWRVGASARACAV